jgi:twitching motility two-component system response regulator PilH
MNMGIFDRIRGLLGGAKEEEEEAAERLTARAPVVPLERRSRKRAEARRGTSVLIVDDSKTIVVALTRMLQSNGFVVSEAYDGEIGVAMARNAPPNLIFLDIVMPGMNGFAALRALRRDPVTQNIPVIMMSGNEHATEQFFGSRIPADDFMKKPFSRMEVFARIEGLLDQEFVPQRRITAGGAYGL